MSDRSPTASHAHIGDPGAGASAEAACTFCGAPTAQDVGRLTVWYGDDLVVVEGVPARTCTGCGETYYEDGAAARIERLVAGGPDAPAPVRTVAAEVYAWKDL